MNGRALTLAFFLSPILGTVGFGQVPTPATIEWIKQNAVPLKSAVAESGFEDLAPLKEIIGEARIVSLGESTHGSREIFQMKHRLLEYLATEMGFSIFSIEANMPEAYRLNDYVLRGEGDPDKLIGGMYFWTWNTREVKDMVEWMRRYNKSGAGRVEFTGFDMQTPTLAMDEVLRFLKQADAKQHAAAELAYEQAKKSTRVAPLEFGVASGTLPVAAVRGKKVTFRGWIKTEKVREYAGLWWRADGPLSKTLAFDNMHAQKIGGTLDWKQYSIDLKVPEEAESIAFGVLMPGQGTAWFDGLEVLLDDKPFAWPDDFDLDFEGEAIRGLFAVQRASYRTDLDKKTSKTGKQSLRMRSVDGPAAVSPAEFKGVLSACEEVLRQLANSRDELAKEHAANDVDWAVVNARLVYNALRQRGGNMAVRDAAMADNVAWILDQNPKAKIVLWAHNFHVSRMPAAMGKFLDAKYGRQHLAVAFATSHGEYQAIGNAGLANHKLQTPPAESYESAFEQTDLSHFFLDLRKVKHDSEDSGWLARPHAFRSVGARAMENQFAPTELPKLYDAVIYLKDTTAAERLRK